MRRRARRRRRPGSPRRRRSWREAERPLIICGRGDGSAAGLLGAGRLRRAVRGPGGRVLAVAPVARDRSPAACGLRRDALARRGRCGRGARCDGALAAAAPRLAGRLPGDPDRPGPVVRGPADAQLPGDGRDHRGTRRCARRRWARRSMQQGGSPGAEARRRRIARAQCRAAGRRSRPRPRRARASR